jgi:hypothetical protein
MKATHATLNISLEVHRIIACSLYLFLSILLFFNFSFSKTSETIGVDLLDINSVQKWLA